jgi:MFS family permease
MSTLARLALLGALCAGALIVGIELFITAVALPRIVPDLADWRQLREASWIVNAYLVAYVAAMPLAGRLADRLGLPRLLMAALALFAVGSVLAGAAQTLEQLILARVVQGAGAGAVLPLVTAGASHLYGGRGRARALGLIGGATFLGMALGPFLGALVLQWLDLGAALRGVGISRGALHDLFVPAWRWIFYLGAPLAFLAMVYVWAAAPDWRVPTDRRGIDTPGAVLFVVALASALLVLTLLGDESAPTGPLIPLVAAAAAVVAGSLAVRRARRTRDPFIDPALFRIPVFSAAVGISLLTGYGLATAIVGSAVFVDRVRFAGPEEQRVVLGSLALAVAVGALAAGLILHRLGAMTVTMAGVVASTLALVGLSMASPATDLALLAALLALFGLGFGLTVTPRSTAAIEAAGPQAAGVASAAVTVARMVGMAVGLAILTGFGTARIDALASILDDAERRDTVLPPELRGRPLENPLVVDALESWAAAEAAATLGSLFLVAAIVTALAALPALVMRERTSEAGLGTMHPGEGSRTDESSAAAGEEEREAPGTAGF